MSNNKVATTVELRQKNRRELLSLLLTKGKTTRNELRNETPFSYTTIGNLINDLQTEEFIIQQGEADSTGGRKAQIIKINGNKALFIAIDVASKEFTWGIYNLEGERLHDSLYGYNKDISFKDNLCSLLQELRDVCEENNYTSRLTYAGIVVPGYYNDKADRISNSYDTEQMETFNLKSTIRQFFDLPILVKNDAKTAAYGEIPLLNDSEKHQLFYFMILKESIGGAFLLNGNVYQGAGGFAGEIYPLGLNWENNEKTLGELLHPTEDMKLLSAAVGEPVSEERFFELFHEKNQSALKIFEKTVEALTKGIIYVVCMLNPSDIRIGGFYNRYGNALLEGIQTRLMEAEEWQRENLNIRFSDFTQHTLIDSINTQMIHKWVDSLWS